MSKHASGLNMRKSILIWQIYSSRKVKLAPPCEPWKGTELEVF